MEWIKPPWQRAEADPDGIDGVGEWPWVGDVFLAAVQFKRVGDADYHWEYYVLAWSESGFECPNTGESWEVAGPDDIEWIARIPEPGEAATPAPKGRDMIDQRKISQILGSEMFCVTCGESIPSGVCEKCGKSGGKIFPGP